MAVKIKKILCPVDFSENSRHALEYAVEFARMHGAELEVLHVIVPPVAAVPDFAPMPTYPPDMIQEYEENCRTQLAGFLQAVDTGNIPVKSEVFCEMPFLGIIREACDKNSDLIVMGTHGRTGLKHMLMGSVAEKVVRKAPCPVLTIRHPEHEFEMP